MSVQSKEVARSKTDSFKKVLTDLGIRYSSTRIGQRDRKIND